MSSGARWVLGIFMLLFGVGFAGMAGADVVPRNGWIFWVFAVFCWLIAVSCIPGRHVAVTGRIVAGAVFCACAWYLFTEIRNPEPYLGRSKPSLTNALFFFGLAGFPAGYVAIFGFYPVWGRLGLIFGRDPRLPQDEDIPDAPYEE